MKPLDPRLLRYARATRNFLIVSVVLGCVSALLILSQAWLIADIVSRAFIGGRSLSDLETAMLLLLAVVLFRALVAWGSELAASRASARSKSQLRTALLERVPGLGLDSAREQSSGELAILATRGIDVLDGYFSLYLPQLFLAVIVPVAVIVAVLWDDWISAAIIAFAVPLIPLFMALVGASTQKRMDRQLRTLEQLAGHFLDVVAGLPTLKIFGRARAQAATIREITERYRLAAMSTLRITFLSSLILELVSTIAVAMVAVAVGLRLMDGHLTLRTALFALVLAPEAFMPLRQLGASYHASAEGIAAAERCSRCSKSLWRRRAARTTFPDPAQAPLEIQDLRVSYEGRSDPALDGISLTVAPGELLAVVGPSGCGKSTLLSVLLGLRTPERGTVTVGGR